MVVLRTASPIEDLPIVCPEHIHIARVGQGTKLVVDGGEPDVLATGSKLGEQLLG
jgi:hypothetical protein